MNQLQVRALFREEWKNAVARNPQLKNDKPAKSLEFGMLIDRLHRAGDITDKQYHSITMEAARTRTTVDEWDIEQQTTEGWEVANTEKTYKAARASLREYKEAMPEYPARITKRRVKLQKA